MEQRPGCEALPKIDGHEVFDTLKANPATANIPLVLVSGQRCALLVVQGDKSPVQERKDQHQNRKAAHQPCQGFDIRFAFLAAPSEQGIPAKEINADPDRFPHIPSPFTRTLSDPHWCQFVQVTRSSASIIRRPTWLPPDGSGGELFFEITIAGLVRLANDCIDTFGHDRSSLQAMMGLLADTDKHAQGMMACQPWAYENEKVKFAYF